MRALKQFLRSNLFCRILIFSFVVVLLRGTFCFCQQGSQREVNLTAYYPKPFVGVYNGACYEVRAKRCMDRDNLSYFLDPSGVSTLNRLVVRGDLKLNSSGAIYSRTGTGMYYLDFNTLGTIPVLFLPSLMTQGRIAMLAGTPYGQNPPVAGKHVYGYPFDIAEGVKVIEGEADDVVVISKKEDLAVVKSKRRFDTRVAGVISGDPKFIIGERADFKPLALAGIVRCNVTAENGPVKKGDLLVTSSLPGHAMRAETKDVKPGMVVGSALEALTQGRGKIYILVNQ